MLDIRKTNISDWYSHHDIRMRLGYQAKALTLSGKGYEGDKRIKQQFPNNYQSLTLFKTYTVSGVVDAYEDLWATGNNELPGAFLSREGVAEVHAAIATVEDAVVQLPAYQAKSILLFHAQDETAQELYERLLPVYQRTCKPSYRVEGFVRNPVGSSQGYVVGKDSDTQEETYVDFYAGENTLSIYYKGRATLCWKVSCMMEA